MSFVLQFTTRIQYQNNIIYCHILCCCHVVKKDHGSKQDEIEQGMKVRAENIAFIDFHSLQQIIC